MSRASTARTADRSSRLVYGSGILIVLGLIAAVFAARPGAPDTAPPAAASTAALVANRGGSALAAREPYFDFGSISMAAGKVSHRFWFGNESRAPVTIYRVYTSCMCTTATLVKGMRTVGRKGALPCAWEAVRP
jgi:hypothetical protein